MLAQGAQAILLALTDQVLSTQISRLTARHNHQQWIDIRSAVSQSVQNALTRYQEYHTEQYVRHTAEGAEKPSDDGAVPSGGNVVHPAASAI